jgi:predicted DNA-binding ribbon-helix-helix protein
MPSTPAGKQERGRRKLVELDEETWTALDVLARDRLASFQELADEAFRDLLRKHHRPVGLRAALKASVKTEPGHKRRAVRAE